MLYGRKNWRSSPFASFDDCKSMTTKLVHVQRGRMAKKTEGQTSRQTKRERDGERVKERHIEST